MDWSFSVACVSGGAICNLMYVVVVLAREGLQGVYVGPCEDVMWVAWV